MKRSATTKSPKSPTRRTKRSHLSEKSSTQIARHFPQFSSPLTKISASPVSTLFPAIFPTYQRTQLSKHAKLRASNLFRSSIPLRSQNDSSNNLPESSPSCEVDMPVTRASKLSYAHFTPNAVLQRHNAPLRANLSDHPDHSHKDEIPHSNNNLKNRHNSNNLSSHRTKEFQNHQNKLRKAKRTAPSIFPQIQINPDQIPTSGFISAAIHQFLGPTRSPKHEALLTTLSKISDSIRSLSSPNHQHDDKSRIYLGGRISAAIESIFDQYKFKGLFLFIDLFHPWLNVIHWTRILNLLVFKDQFNLALQIFEQYVLPPSTTTSSNQSPSSPPSSFSSFSFWQASQSTTSPSSKDAVTGSLFVDHKLVNQVIKAYSRTRPQSHLFQFLVTLESQRLLPDPDSIKALLVDASSSSHDYCSESTLSRHALNSINPLHQQSRLHPYITYSLLMAYYQHYSRSQLLSFVTPTTPPSTSSLSKFKSITQSSTKHDRPNSKQPISAPIDISDDEIIPIGSTIVSRSNSHPPQSTKKKFDTKNDNNAVPKLPLIAQHSIPFIHTNGQIQSLAPLYSEMGFLIPLHGLIVEHLATQGSVELPSINSIFNLGFRLSRLDLVYGFLQHRYQYISRHLSPHRFDQNRQLADHYTASSSSNLPLALSWFQLSLPSTPLTNPDEAKTAVSTQSQQQQRQRQQSHPFQSLQNSKDHFAHTVDYDNLDFSTLAVSVPSPTLPSLSSSPTSTSPSLKRLALPKFSTYKRFVMVETDIGTGIECPTHCDAYYSTIQSATPPPSSTSRLASILPTSLRYSANAAKSQPLLQNAHPAVLTTISPQSNFFHTAESLHVIRQLQPDPLHVISIRPTRFINRQQPHHKRASISPPTPSTPDQSTFTSILPHRREIIDTELKIRQKVQLPITTLPEQLHNPSPLLTPSKVDIIPLLPSLSTSNPYSQDPTQLFSTLSHKLHHFFATQHHVPILPNPHAMAGLSKALSTSRSFETLVHLTRTFQQSSTTNQPLPFSLNTLTHSPLFHHLALSASGQIINPSLRLLAAAAAATTTTTVESPLLSSLKFVTHTNSQSTPTSQSSLSSSQINPEFSHAKYNLPLYLAPFLLQYHHPQHNIQDRSAILASFHLLSSFPDPSTTTATPSDLTDHEGFVTVPTLEQQFTIQYPHLNPNQPSSQSNDSFKPPQRLRLGLAACRHVFLSLLAAVIDSQTHLTADIVADYHNALGQSNSKLHTSKSQYTPKQPHHSLPNNSLSTQCPLSTQFVSDSLGISQHQVANADPNYTPLSHAAQTQFQHQLTQWKTKSRHQIAILLSFLQSYSAVQHHEVVEEYFESLLPFLLSHSDALSLTPTELESVCRIAVDLGIKTHRAIDLDKQYKLQAPTSLSDSLKVSLSTDAYLVALGLPPPLLSPHLTASSSLHTKLLKLLALLTEKTKGTTQEFILQLSLASYIVNHFGQSGDINSALLWGTLISHMKQNINRSVSVESDHQNVNQEDLSFVPTLLKRLQRSEHTADILMPLDQQHIIDSFAASSSSAYQRSSSSSTPSPISPQSDPPTLPRPFFPTHLLSPTFILRSHTNQFSSLPLSSSIHFHSWPTGIAPVTSLGEILRMIPDFSSLSASPSKTLQQALRLFEHALLVSESHPTLPRLMASVLYIDSLYSLFRSIIAGPISTPSSCFSQQQQQQQLSHHPQLQHQSPQYLTPTQTLQTIRSGYYLFWHLLACMEQKQIQHLTGVETASISKNDHNFHYLHQNPDSPGVLASLDQLLSQPQHFNLNDTVSNLFILGTKLSTLSLHPQTPNPPDTTPQEDIKTQSALLEYTDSLFSNIVSIWSSSPSYHDLLSDQSPLSAHTITTEQPNELDVAKQSGPLSFVAPTEAVLAALQTYLHARLTHQPSHLPASTLSLKSFTTLNTATEHYIAHHSPTPLQKLESFKLYRDHKHQVILDGLSDILSDPKHCDYQGDFAIVHSPIEHEIDLVMEAVQREVTTVTSLDQRNLTQLTSGQYPYPTQLTLTTESNVVVSPHQTHPPSTVESDLAMVCGGDQTDSHTASSSAPSTWAPSRSDLLHQITQQQESKPPINTIHLKHNTTTLQIDSHLTTHQVTQTLLLLTDLLNTRSTPNHATILSKSIHFLQSLAQNETPCYVASLDLQTSPQVDNYDQPRDTSSILYLPTELDGETTVERQSFQAFHNSLIQGCSQQLAATTPRTTTPEQQPAHHLFLLKSNRTLSRQEHDQFTSLLGMLAQ